jgi:acid phosphatase
VALLAVLALSACQSTRAPRSAPPPGTHEGLNAILWLQTAAEYRAATRQAFRSATVHLDLALAEPTWTAAPEQTGDFGDLPPAVVLDMDEAILRSDRFQAWLVKEDERYRLEDWNAWVRTETSEAIAGALEYVAAATARGVQIFYVTNRTAEVEEETLATLRKVGFPIESADDLLTQDERPEWGADKSSRRAEIAATHRILQIVGDNLNDFTGGAHDSVEARRALAERYSGYWGARWIITPNPSYGGWEGALTGFERGLSRAERIRRKRSFLESWR